MRPDYKGVKYYGPNDWSLGLHFERARTLIESIDSDKEYININEIIEFYNAHQIITSSSIRTEYIKPYQSQVRNSVELCARYFTNINDETLQENYNSVCISYVDDFWSLFDKFKVYERISDSVFKRVLNESEIKLYQILKHKNVVKHYDEIIAEFMRQSNQTARIIISKFLEKKTNQTKTEYYLPMSLKQSEFEAIIEKYINSEFSNVGVIQLVANSQSSAECPISDALRLKARRKAKEIFAVHGNEGIGLNLAMSVCFKNNPETISYKEIKPQEYQITYDLNWIQENLDYPTLLNNFIFLFNYVDLCSRCSFVSIQSKMGVIEKHLGLKGIKEYEIGTAFMVADLKSLAELKAYSSVLSQFNIRIEDLVQWFFTEYLKTEYNVNGFTINMPSKESTVLEKCRTVLSEMDGILKQYRMFVSNHSMDRELLEISSNPVRFEELPSLIARKYAYANSNDIIREQFLLFSDQCMLNYLPQYEEEESFCDLVKKHSAKLLDYSEWETADLKWLESRNDIIIDEAGIIHLNMPRVHLLRDLYDHDVVCVSYYKDTNLIEQLVISGDLRCERSLFSIPEQKYLNYMLNKSEFSNGLDLRNKYIHSTYPLNITQQEKDYLQVLKILIIIVIKINEEFCLSNPE